MARAQADGSGARLCGLGRKNHTPWHGGLAAPQLGVDEIGNAHKENGNRCGQRDPVGKLRQGHLVAQAKDINRQNNAKKSTMERHAAGPDLRDLDRVGQIIGGLVEHDIAQTPPHNHADDDIRQQVFQFGHRHR